MFSSAPLEAISSSGNASERPRKITLRPNSLFFCSLIDIFVLISYREIERGGGGGEIEFLLPPRGDLETSRWRKWPSLDDIHAMNAVRTVAKREIPTMKCLWRDTVGSGSHFAESPNLIFLRLRQKCTNSSHPMSPPRPHSALFPNSHLLAGEGNE